MAMTEKQIQDIERYLDYHELKQVDLRYEVLDHIAESIEAAMEEGVSYVGALNQQREKWNPELDNYSSLWLGLAFSGPKMMIKKCVQMIKNIYLFALLSGVLISGILFFILKLLPLDALGNILDIFINILFGTLFLGTLFLFYKIKRTGIKTTYQYFFQMQSWGYIICVFSFTLKSNTPFFLSNITYIEFFFPVFFILVWLQFYKVYNKHIGVVKRRLI